jgi:ribonuclease HI
VLEYNTVTLMTVAPQQLKLLDRIQTQCLGIILGCTARASPTAMEVHASVQPLGLRRLKLAARFISHILRHPDNHPLKQLATTTSPAKFTPKLTPNKSLTVNFSLPQKTVSPFYILSSVQNLLKLDVDDVPKEPHLIWTRPPWTNPTIYTHSEKGLWDQAALGSTSTRDAAASKKALDFSMQQLTSILQHHVAAPLIILIFTDGSASDKGGGSGVVIYTSVTPHTKTPSLDFLGSFPLGPICSNSLAELHAIEKALLLVTSINPPPPPQSTIHIFSDSQYAATVSESGYIPHSSSYWLTIKHISALQLALSRKGVRTHTHWTPGHCGFQPNTLADTQANKAAHRASHLSFPSPVPIPYQLTKTAIAKRIATIWDTWWSNSHSMAHVAHQTHPRASWCFPLTLFRNVPRKLQVAFSRISLGNAPTNNIVAPLLNISSQCDHCPTTDSTKHRLFACPHYQPQRDLLRTQTSSIWQDYSALNLRSLPATARPVHLTAILNFLSTTDLESTFVRTATNNTSTSP